MVAVHGRCAYNFDFDGFSHLSLSLTSTLTLSLVMLWCSCAQCSPTAVSGFLRLIWSFILVASILPVSPMYVI